jgi:hypothetical protein
MKFIFFMIGSVFSLSSNLCSNCKHYIKPTGKTVGTCSLFPLLDNVYLDCIRSRKIYYMCGEKGRYYEDVSFLSIDHSDHSHSVHSDHSHSVHSDHSHSDHSDHF